MIRRLCTTVVVFVALHQAVARAQGPGLLPRLPIFSSWDPCGSFVTQQDFFNEKKNGDAKPNGGDAKNGKEESEKPPRTLLEWRVGKKDDGGDEEEEEDTIATDRPDFTESSSTVGKGRVQLEAGYTYIRDRQNGTTVETHSYPEALLRIGMFAEWFEFRIGQNLASERTRSATENSRANGAEDLYLGVKFFLAEQQGVLPETSVVLQMTVPSGASAFTADEVLPGVNLLYGWDVVKGKLDAGGSTQINRARSGHTVTFPLAAANHEVGNSYTELAQSFTTGISFTEKLRLYNEFFGIFPHSSTDPETVAEYYYNAGFTYLVTPNFQLDIRAGMGLNRHADDFFAGSGFAIRY
jgi:hypothetical protein